MKMLNIQLLENMTKILINEDPSVIEIKRVLAIQDAALQEKGLKAWLKQYQKEAAAKPFLSLLAHTLALQLNLNDPQAVPFIQALIKSLPEDLHASIIAILNNPRVTREPLFDFFVISDSVMERFQKLSKKLRPDEFKSLINYYKGGINFCIQKMKPDNVLEFLSKVDDKAWPIFYEKFKESIDRFLKDKCNLTFDPESMKTHLNDLYKHLSSYQSMAVAIYGLLGGKSTIDNDDFFKNLHNEPLLKQAWQIAVVPDETQRREAACKAVFGENVASLSGATSSPVRFSVDTADPNVQKKLDAIRVATTLKKQ